MTAAERIASVNDTGILIEQSTIAIVSTPTITSVVVGVHGGAGSSTLAHLLGDAVVMPLGDWTALLDTPTPVVLVARGTPDAATKATDAVRAAVSADVRIGALVVVADGPWPEPVASRARYRLLEQEVGAVIRLPYVGRWRYDAPELATATRSARRALDQIRAAITA